MHRILYVVVICLYVQFILLLCDAVVNSWSLFSVRIGRSKADVL